MKIKLVKFRFNSILFGLIMGIIVPMILLVIFFNSTDYSSSFSSFIRSLSQLNILYKIISVCVIPNLLVFYLFIWKDRLLAARGVLMATLIYALTIFVLFFIV